MKVPVEVSARHIHLCKKDLEGLFGKGARLDIFKELSQPGEFAAVQTADIVYNGKTIKNIRVVGPEREATQVEISITDAVFLAANVPIRLSGDTKGSAAIKIIGPAGEIDLHEGMIVAKRHMHCAPGEAEKMGIKSGQAVSVKIDGERPMVFGDVIARVDESHRLCVHLDTDEGNASGINKTTEGEIIL